VQRFLVSLGVFVPLSPVTPTLRGSILSNITYFLGHATIGQLLQTFLATPAIIAAGYAVPLANSTLVPAPVISTVVADNSGGPPSPSSSASSSQTLSVGVWFSVAVAAAFFAIFCVFLCVFCARQRPWKSKNLAQVTPLPVVVDDNAPLINGETDVRRESAGTRVVVVSGRGVGGEIDVSTPSAPDTKTSAFIGVDSHAGFESEQENSAISGVDSHAGIASEDETRVEAIMSPALDASPGDTEAASPRSTADASDGASAALEVADAGMSDEPRADVEQLVCDNAPSAVDASIEKTTVDDSTLEPKGIHESQAQHSERASYANARRCFTDVPLERVVSSQMPHRSRALLGSLGGLENHGLPESAENTPALGDGDVDVLSSTPGDIVVGSLVATPHAVVAHPHESIALKPELAGCTESLREEILLLKTCLRSIPQPLASAASSSTVPREEGDIAGTVEALFAAPVVHDGSGSIRDTGDVSTHTHSPSLPVETIPGVIQTPSLASHLFQQLVLRSSRFILQSSMSFSCRLPNHRPRPKRPSRSLFSLQSPNKCSDVAAGPIGPATDDSNGRLSPTASDVPVGINLSAVQASPSRGDSDVTVVDLAPGVVLVPARKQLGAC